MNDPYDMDRVELLREFSKLQAEFAIYRAYYLASEENFVLCDTVGVTKEQWDAAQHRYETAIAACGALESSRDTVVEEHLPKQE